MKMELEFELEPRFWERTFSALRQGDTLPAAHFLAALAQATEEQAEEAALELEERGVLLDVSQLPAPSVSDKLAERFALEQELLCGTKTIAALPENDPLRLFLQEMDNQQPLPPDEETELARLAADGNVEAAEKLTAAGLHRVLAIAKAYAGRGVLLVDLLQEGSLGLWQAIVGLTQGQNFEKAASWRIRQAMARAVAMEYRVSNAGEGLGEALRRYQEADRTLLYRLGRNPGEEELAAELGVSVQKVWELKKLLQEASKKAPKPENAEDDAPVEDTAYFQQRMRIEQLLSGLQETDQQLLSLRFGLEGKPPVSQEEAAQLLQLPLAQVQKREMEALSALRAKSND